MVQPRKVMPEIPECLQTRATNYHAIPRCQVQPMHDASSVLCFDKGLSILKTMLIMTVGKHPRRVWTAAILVLGGRH